MKAAVFKAPGQPLVIEERPEPEPETGEVLIRVRRTGICGSDLHMTSGHGQQLALDSVIGHEFCGEVVALGPGVQRLQLGDRVAPLPYIGCGECLACRVGRPIGCPHLKPVVAGFCEYSRVGERDCVLLPPEVTDAAGALIEPLATGLQGVRKARLEVGARVLVTGAGAIGLAAAFWAGRLGAGKVAVMASSTRRQPIAGVDVNAKGDWTVAVVDGDGDPVSPETKVEMGEKDDATLGDLGKPIVFYCRSGRRTLQALEFAQTRGRPDVKAHFGGSWLAWTAAGEPVKTP